MSGPRQQVATDTLVLAAEAERYLLDSGVHPSRLVNVPPATLIEWVDALRRMGSG